MADVISTANEVQFAFKLERGDETTTRTLAMPGWSLSNTDADSLTAEARAGGLSFRNYVLGSASTFIQPSSWRDGDSEEEEWRTADVEITYVSTRKRTVDPT